MFLLASLSSQSSRDGSPSQLPPNLNHINCEKSINSTNNYINYESYSNSNNAYGQLYSESVNANSNRATIAPYSSDQDNDINHSQRFTSSQYRQPPTASPQITSSFNTVQKSIYNSSHLMNQSLNDPKQYTSLYTSPKLDGQLQYQKGLDNHSKSVENLQTSHSGAGDYNSSYTQSVNNIYRQENVLPNQMLKPENYPVSGHHGYPSQKPVMPQQGSQYINSPQENHAYSVAPVENSIRSPYQQNYTPYTSPASSYGARQVTSPSANRSNDEPISSGPPRTNVLGIIPYSSVSTLSFIVIDIICYVMYNVTVDPS